MVKASVLALFLFSAAHAARVDLDNQHALLSGSEASASGAETAARLTHQLKQEPTGRTTSQNYLVAVLCTALAYFMNFEGNLKAANPNDHPAEDSKLGIDENRKKEYDARVRAQGGVDRWTRIATNQAENFPFHLWVFWSALMAGAGSAGSQGAVNCFVAYMTFRFLYVICYIYALAPWRTIVFLCSQLSVAVGAVFGVSAANSSLPGISTASAQFRLVAMAVATLFFVLNFFARAKSINPNNHPAEDAKIGLSEEQKRSYTEARQGAGPNRWERIAVNQAETIPVSLAVYWGAYSVLGVDAPEFCTLLLGTYFVLRIVFIVCYVFSLQPFRSLSWALSNVVTLFAGILGMVGCFYGQQRGDMSAFFMMASTVVIWFLNVMAVFRAIDPNNHPAEDALSEEGLVAYKKRLEEQGGVDRWTRVSINQLENFPVHLVALWGVATIAEHREYISFCFLAYTTLRILFVVCYLFALTPWRSIMFASSQITMVTVLVLGVLHAKDAYAEGAWMPLYGRGRECPPHGRQGVGCGGH